MSYLNDFNAVLGPGVDLAYQQSIVEQINKNRRLLEGELFFDKMLEAMGVHQASQFYPPRSNQDLRNLYEQIVRTASRDHHKQSLIYYILKDLKLEWRSAEIFAEKTYLPEKYKIFINGIWCMDRLEMEESLYSLTEPCLTPTFPEEILYTLCRHFQNDPSLPLQYYHTASPKLTSRKVVDALFTAMCQASVTEAYQFCETQEEMAHRRLFENLISFVLGSSDAPIRGARGVELINLPFSSEEEDWFEEYLLSSKGKGLYGAKDTVLMRRVVLGRSVGATGLGYGIKERMIDGLNWSGLTQCMETMR